MLNAKWIDNLLLSVKKAAFLNHKKEGGAGHEFIELSTSLIRYKLIGSGAQTIAFVPDPPNVIEHYAVLADLLKDDYSVLLFELPGLGFSLPTQRNFDYSLGSYAAIAAELLQKLAVGPAVLAFPCVWGYVAVKVAEKHPALVQGIITMQAPAWEQEVAWAKKIDTYNLVNKPLVGQLVMLLAAKWVARKWYAYALPKQKYDAAFYRLSAAKLRQGGCFCLASLTQGLFHQKTQPAFRPVAVPAITIWGDEDRSHQRSDPNSSTSFFSNAQVYHFEGCGHFPELESPEEFVQVLKQWQAAQG